MGLRHTGPMPSPPPARRGRRTSDRRVLQQGMWLVAALAVIGISLFAGSLVFSDDGTPASDSAPAAAPTSPAAPSVSASEPSTPSASPTPAAATRSGMSGFVRDYLTAVADDPAIAWDKLTPGFQRTSGGFADYRTFWAPITRAEPSNVSPDPGAGTVSYDVRYTYADGHTSNDSTRLTLQYADATYRISGEG